MHVHVWDEGYQPQKYKLGFATRAANRRFPPRDPAGILPRVMPGASDPRGELLLGDMDRFGVDAVAAMVVDFGFAVGEQQATPIGEVIENHGRLIKAHPGRFHAFFGMDPRRPGSLERFEQAVREEGFSGLKMYPGCGFYPWDDVCLPFYKLASDLNVPVLFHTAPVGWPLTARFAHPMHLGDVQRDFPDLSIIFGHVGGVPWWKDAVTIAAGHWNSYLELSQWERRMTAPEDLVRTLGEMRDQVGAHRILFGSDYAAGPAKSGDKSNWGHWIEFFRELPERGRAIGVAFSEDEVALMLGGNAARLLKLPASQPSNDAVRSESAI